MRRIPWPNFGIEVKTGIVHRYSSDTSRCMRSLTRERLCIVIPAYEEEGRIGAIATRAVTHGDVLVVDDGSRDATSMEAHSAGARVIRLEPNQGKGSAIRVGLEQFLRGSWDAVVLMDADGQHDPDEIERLADVWRRTRSPMVIGNRMDRVAKMPLVRKATNWIMSRLLSLTAGVNVPDTQCGFRLIARPLAEKLALKTCRYEVESEMLIQAARFTKHIASAPISTIYTGQKSNIRPLMDTLRFLRLMGRVVMGRILHKGRKREPET